MTRTLLVFDLSDVPTGATITLVTLTVHINRTQSGPIAVGVHKLLTNWGEASSIGARGGGAGASAKSDDATWIHTFFDSQTWASPGGDFQATPSSSSTVSKGQSSWSSNQMIADVQSWIDNSPENFGWILVAEDEVALRTSKRFTSREGSSEEWPRLTIEFTLTGGQTAKSLQT